MQLDRINGGALGEGSTITTGENHENYVGLPGQRESRGRDLNAHTCAAYLWRLAGQCNAPLFQ